MFFNHLKSFIRSLVIFFLNLLILFFINLYYSDVLIYYFFSKLLKFKILYATSLFEIVITKINLAIMLTIIFSYPLILIYILTYLVPGIYNYEFKFNLRRLITLINSYILELTIYMYAILPAIIIYSKEPLHNNFISNYIVQIHTFHNITNMTMRILILGLVAHVTAVFNIRIMKNKMQIPRKYIPIIGVLLSILTPFNSDILIQLFLTGIVFVYVEIVKLKYYWGKNK
jgi:Sec-independent protein secretion pathway component TatC